MTAPIVRYPKDDPQYVLRGIRYKDANALADILADRADDGTGDYTLSFADVHCRDFRRWNNEFVPLPGPVIPDSPIGTTVQSLTWMLEFKDPDYGWQVIGFANLRFLFYTCDIHYMAIDPEYRGAGHSTAMNLMLRTLIEPLGVKDITFKALASAPQVTAHAEERLELKPVEKEEGATGQEVTKYEFTADEQKERLKDPKNADEIIDVKIEAVPVKEATEEPVLDQPADQPIEEVKPRS